MTPEVPEQIAVIIVSRGQREALFRSLEAIAVAGIHVIVIDLGSQDGSLDAEEAFPAVQFIKLPKNFGITKALNLGIRACSADYALLMSQPYRLAAADVFAMAREMETDSSIGGLVAWISGEPQVSPLPTPANPEPPPQAAQAGAKAECATGPLMVRRFLLTSLQKIDERYGDYGSEPELCMQVQRAGKRVVIADAQATAAGLATQPTALAIADRQLGVAAYLGKHYGLLTGIRVHLKYLLGALFGFELARFRYLITGQKIDGTQS